MYNAPCPCKTRKWHMRVFCNSAQLWPHYKLCIESLTLMRSLGKNLERMMGIVLHARHKKQDNSALGWQSQLHLCYTLQYILSAIKFLREHRRAGFVVCSNKSDTNKKSGKGASFVFELVPHIGHTTWPFAIVFFSQHAKQAV